MKFRTGRKVPRNLYLQMGAEPSDNDLDIGRIDDEHMAKVIVSMLNEVQFSGEVIGMWEANIIYAAGRIKRTR
jgi:hypothetical protein